MKNKIRIIFGIFLILFPFKSLALIEVDITRGNLNPLPIAESPLSSDDTSISALNKKLNIKNLRSI